MGQGDVRGDPRVSRFVGVERPDRLVVVLLAAVAFGASADAQIAPTDAPTIEITHVIFPEAVAAGLPRGGGWLPIYCELVATGARPQEVDLEAVVRPIDGGPRFTARKSILVAPGAPKRAWLHVLAPPDVDTEVAFEIRSGGRVVRTGDRWSARSAPADAADEAPVIFVAGGAESDQRLWFGSQFGDQLSCDVAHWFEPHQLPDRPLGYHAARLLVLRGVDESRLEEAQLTALREWVHAGGFAVLVLDRRRGAESLAGPFARDALGDPPPEVGTEAGYRPRGLWSTVRTGAPAIRDPRRRARFDTERAGDPTGGASTRGDPLDDRLRVATESQLALGAEVSFTRFVVADRPGLEDVILADAPDGGRVPIYREARFGRGKVGLLLLDDQEHAYSQTRNLRELLWRQILDRRDSSDSGPWARRARPSGDGALVQSVLADTSRDVGTSLIAAVIVVYLLVVGPGVYFWLRRRGKLHAILWVEPLVILIALVAVVALGYVSKGVLTRARLYTVLQQVGEERLAYRESYLAIFSAAQADYRITAPGADFLRPLFANEDEARDVVVVEGGDGASADGRDRDQLVLSGQRLDLWQNGYAVSAGVEAGTGLRVVAEASDEGANSAGPSRWRLVNETGFDILDARLRPPGAGGAWLELAGPIANGESLSFAVADLASVEGLGVKTGADAKAPGEYEVVAGLLGRGGGLERAGQAWFVARIDRGTSDFRLSEPFTVAERRDWIVLHEPLAGGGP